VLLDGVVDDLDLGRIDAIVMRDLVFGEIAYGDDLHRAVHAAAFDVVDALIDVSTATVKLRGVDVNDERHALHRGNRQASGERHPVMRVNDIEPFMAADLGGEGRIALHFAEQIAGVVVASPSALK